MQHFSAALAAHIEGGPTTLCHCWRLTRKDGVALGFTDHDCDLVIGGFTFEAAGGVEITARDAAASLAAGGADIRGALTSARLLPEDIEAGHYDGAELRQWLVNWQAPALDDLIDCATLGEIRLSDGQFFAETRNAFHALEAERGRLYTVSCTAELGDTRCGLALESSGLAQTDHVSQTDGRLMLIAPAFASVAQGRFTRGSLHILTGVNAGLVVPIKAHGAGGSLTLWQPLAKPLAVGDQVRALPGCDKRFATCRDLFANALNFRGFPFIPAPETVVLYARPGEGTHLGRPLVR